MVFYFPFKIRLICHQKQWFSQHGGIVQSDHFYDQIHQCQPNSTKTKLVSVIRIEYPSRNCRIMWSCELTRNLDNFETNTLLINISWHMRMEHNNSGFMAEPQGGCETTQWSQNFVHYAFFSSIFANMNYPLEQHSKLPYRADISYSYHIHSSTHKRIKKYIYIPWLNP